MNAYAAAYAARCDAAEPRHAKQTAANNPVLKSIKALWNAPIYAKCMAYMNSGGIDAVLGYLLQFVGRPADADCVARRNEYARTLLAGTAYATPERMARFAA